MAQDEKGNVLHPTTGEPLDLTEQKFFVVQRLWSNKYGRNLESGETLLLDDLSAGAVDKLMAANVITPAEELTAARAAAQVQRADNVPAAPEHAPAHRRKSKS